MQNSTYPPVPTSGYDLAKTIDCPLDEGVIVAVFPEIIESVHSVELPFLDSKGQKCRGVLVDVPGWGTRLLDIESPTGKPIKWWHVRNYPDIQPIPERWHGPIGEIPSRYFEENYVLAVRFYQRGPWAFPRERPTITMEMEAKQQLEEIIDGGL